MAEVKKHGSGGGGMPFGLEVLLFVLAIFIIWVLTGGAKKEVEDKPFITPLTDPINAGETYGPDDIKNTYNYQQNFGSGYGPTDETGQ